MDLAEYKGGAVTVRVPRIEITDAQVRQDRERVGGGGGRIERELTRLIAALKTAVYR